MKTAIVIGGGIAGCSSAYSFAQHGFEVTLLERQPELAAEASGNPLAILNPRLSGQHTALEALNLHGYLHSLDLVSSLGFERCQYHACGVIQLAHDQKSQARLQAAQKMYLDNALFEYLDAKHLSDVAGVHLQHEGLRFPNAGGVNLPALCRVLTAHSNIRIQYSQAALQIKQRNGQWLVNVDKSEFFADVVVIANANDAQQLQQSAYVPLTAVRGQLSYLGSTESSAKLNTILCSEGYITPALGDFHYLGASFNPHDEDATVRISDHESNLQLLDSMSPSLYEALKDKVVSGRVAWRSQSPDYLPVAGQMIDPRRFTSQKFFYNDPPAKLPWLEGLYINAGHGSKGFLSAPLCAQIIADHAAGVDSALPKTLLNALQPNRFILRKRGLKHLSQHLIE